MKGQTAAAIAHRLEGFQPERAPGGSSWLRRDTTLLSAFLLDQWLPAVELEVAAGTYRRTAMLATTYLVPRIGHLRVCDLDPLVVRDLYSELSRAPLSNGSGEMTKETLRAIAWTFGWALEALVRGGRLPANPAWGQLPRRTKSEIYEHNVWTPGELLAFLDLARNDRLYALWNFLALTGTIRSEALALQWHDVSDDLSEVVIRRKLTLVGAEGYEMEAVAIPDRRVDLLVRTTSALRRLHRKPQTHGASWVFMQLDGSPLRPDAVTRWWAALLRRLGLRYIRLYDLRHTHATHLLEAGASLKAVQVRLGHATPGYTMEKYQHMVPTIQGPAVKSLRAMYRNTDR